MHAAVYKGRSVVAVEQVPTPEIGPGELLVRVEACGICHTDLKKIEYNLLAPPRVYGHETAGVVVAVGSGVTKFRRGDRGVAFHHIPCRQCFYFRRKLYAQCPVYKKVGITAGFEPGRGADLVIVAASAPGIVDQAMACSRPGARILLFAQTSATERIETAGADLCVGERALFGCYSASVDLQKESAKLIFGGEIPVEAL